jgi:putative spermidine/putrescine transport system permease protein
MKNAMTSFFIAPIVVPTVVTATGIFYFYSRLGMVGNLIGLIVAHTAICVPFVVLSVSSSLARFDRRLSDAAASLGASPSKAFYTVTLPAISPGIWTGAILAFVTSWDEVVLAMFLAGPEQHTVPRRMWSGLREYISPAIIAVATILIMLSIGLLAITQWIQSRNDRRHAAAATE